MHKRGIETVPKGNDLALAGCAKGLLSGAATMGTSVKEFTMGAEGASRRWRCPIGLIIVHLSEAESRSCANPACQTLSTLTSTPPKQPPFAIFGPKLYSSRGSATQPQEWFFTKSASSCAR